MSAARAVFAFRRRASESFLAPTYLSPTGRTTGGPPVSHYRSQADPACGQFMCNCTCGTPEGVCTGSIRLFADVTCAASSASVKLDLTPGCHPYMGVDINGGAFIADYQSTSETCAV
jgi:hypothetical protein